MDTFKLLRMSEKLNINVFDRSLKNKKAFCDEDSIVIDFRKIESERESKKILSEEMGHILQGALYPLSFCGNRLYKLNVQQNERRAKNYSIQLQVPLKNLKSAIKDSYDDYEIAEKLDIDIDLLEEAVEYYRTKGLI